MNRIAHTPFNQSVAQGRLGELAPKICPHDVARAGRPTPTPPSAALIIGTLLAPLSNYYFSEPPAAHQFMNISPLSFPKTF